MRLIDADALRDAVIWHRPSALRCSMEDEHRKDAIDAAVAEIDAAPTICCQRCGHWGWNADAEPFFRHCSVLSRGVTNDFGCVHFTPREEPA